MVHVLLVGVGGWDWIVILVVQIQLDYSTCIGKVVSSVSQSP